MERRRRDIRGVAGAEGVGYGEGLFPSPADWGSLWERRELPQRGPGQSPGRQQFWDISGLKNDAGGSKNIIFLQPASSWFS
jgi:hypothetical protein